MGYAHDAYSKVIERALFQNDMGLDKLREHRLRAPFSGKVPYYGKFTLVLLFAVALSFHNSLSPFLYH